MITKAQVIETLELIERKFPAEQMNAMNGALCVYTDEQDNHCIAAQVQVQLGLPVPSAESEVVLQNDVFTALYEDDALEFLNEVQNTADIGTGIVPRGAGATQPWGRVIEFWRARNWEAL